MTFKNYKNYTQKVEQTISDMILLIESTEESLLYIKPSKDEWSVMQIACHVIEALDFWFADLQALLIVPGAKWGRNHEHVRRLAAVEETVVNATSKAHIIAELQSFPQVAKTIFLDVKEEDLEKTAPSYNVNFDGKPLSFLITHLITGHIEGHLGQMQRHLEKVQKQEV